MKSGRKDHKNRVLREGESQGKEGRYRYTYYENSYTVLELVECCVALKTGVRKSTQAGYKTIINVLKKDEFGGRKISDIRI